MMNALGKINPLKTLADNDQLSAYFHNAIWQPMDMLKDKNFLEELWRF